MIVAFPRHLLDIHIGTLVEQSFAFIYGIRLIYVDHRSSSISAVSIGTLADFTKLPTPCTCPDDYDANNHES